VPARQPYRSPENRRRRRYLPPDLHADPVFAVDSNSWHNWRQTEEAPRRQAVFLSNRDFPFDRPPPPRRRTRQPPMPPQDDDDEDCDALAYHNKEAKDDSDDFIACILQDC
jgi:hypothetical protein